MYVLLEHFTVDAVHAAPDIDRRLAPLAARTLGIRPHRVSDCRILAKSVDARRGRPRLIYTLLIETEETAGLNAAPPEAVAAALTEPELTLPASSLLHPVVVGTGPAGIFAALALALAGCRPLILDRGRDVETRVADCRKFQTSRKLDEESNLLIGEGGAGTFSDGKLYTGTRDPLTAFVLSTFVRAGAPPEIRYLKRPHIGSDRLRRIAVRLRARIEELGGTFRFGVNVAGILRRGGRCAGVVTADGERIEGPATLIAAGLGGRALMRSLAENEHLGHARKPFQIGCRIEHPQEWIDRSQYHRDAPRPAALGAAEYHLVSRPAGDTPHVSSFCMCPGGEILNATAWSGQSLTNGMSDYARAGEFGNGCLIVTREPGTGGSAAEDYALLETLERRIFAAGGGDYTLPAQDAAAFLAGRAALASERSSCRCGIRSGRLDELLPPELCRGISAALRHFDRQMPGFVKYGKLIGAETCVSSPLRFLRDPASGESTLPGLRLAGEGAGAAGGILSAAVDGLRQAERMLGA